MPKQRIKHLVKKNKEHNNMVARTLEILSGLPEDRLDEAIDELTAAKDFDSSVYVTPSSVQDAINAIKRKKLEQGTPYAEDDAPKISEILSPEEYPMDTGGLKGDINSNLNSSIYTQGVNGVNVDMPNPEPEPKTSEDKLMEILPLLLGGAGAFSTVGKAFSTKEFLRSLTNRLSTIDGRTVEGKLLRKELTNAFRSDPMRSFAKGKLKSGEFSKGESGNLASEYLKYFIGK